MLSRHARGRQSIHKSYMPNKQGFQRRICPLDRLLGSLEALLEPPGALLAASWSLFECSWGGLGASWALLGRPRGDTHAHFQTPERHIHAHMRTCQKKINLRCDWGGLVQRFWGGIWHPKIDQNRSQNESKFKTIFKTEKNALQKPLGAVLGRSWSILEAILGSKFALWY